MAARITGLIAALILGLLLLLVVVGSLRHEDLVVATNGVTAGGARDNPLDNANASALGPRAQLQEWPEGNAAAKPSLALGADEPADQDGSGKRRVEQWLADREKVKDILQPAKMQRGVATLPAPEADVLVQPQGRSWRQWRNDQIFYGGAFYVFGVAFLIAMFLAWRGRIPIREGESGQSVERFSGFERANHWLTAGSFVLMALTGLIFLYGHALIRSWLGANAYAPVARSSAWLHVMFAVPFVIGMLVMIVLWIGQNIPERLDWEWLKRGGGFVSDTQQNPPARKSNAGQKLVFWGVILGGLFLTATGVGLMFPFFWSGYGGMQLAQLLHATVGLLLIGLIIGHIYIGTIGMQGAFDAMWSGRVDRNWAKEHHSLWYRTVAQKTEASSTRRQSAPVVTFASGTIVAILIALGMVAIYRTASISDTELAAARNPPSVHVQAEAEAGGRK